MRTNDAGDDNIAIILLLGFLGYLIMVMGYLAIQSIPKEGQKDALTNETKYELVEQSDGSIILVKKDKGVQGIEAEYVEVDKNCAETMPDNPQ